MPPVGMGHCLKIESEVFWSEKAAPGLVDLWPWNHRGVKAQTRGIQTLREENWEVKAVGQDRLGNRVGNIGITWGQHLPGIWKGRHLKIDDCPIPRRTVRSLSFLVCSLQHKTAGYVLPLLFIALPGRFSTLSQFSDLNFGYSVSIC